MLVAFNRFFIEGAPSAATAPPAKRYEHLTGVAGKGNDFGRSSALAVFRSEALTLSACARRVGYHGSLY